MKLSILIPVYNEIQYLDIFTNRLKKSFAKEEVEYIFINDGSTDGSKEWLENYIDKEDSKKNILINITKNQGKGNALHQGLKKSKGQYILFQDSDLELNTNDSLEMYNIISDNKNIECIFGSRYVSGKLKQNSNFLNELINKINSFIYNIIFFQSISDVHCGAKIITKDIKNKINLKIKDFGFEIDLASQIAKNKIDIFEYGISYFARTVEEGKKITWIDGLKSYYYLFKTRFVDNELSTQFSIIFSIIYMVYVGSHFGMGIGTNLVMIFTLIVGLFIGIKRKIGSSSIIFLFIYIGGLFSKGNGKIYSVIIGFIIGIYISRRIQFYFKNYSKNKIIDFLF